MTAPLDYPAPSTESAPEDSFVQRWLMLLFVWAPAALFFTAFVASITGLAFTYFGVYAGPIMGLFFAYALYRFQTVRRQRRAMIILSYLETAVRLNLPLDQYLLAAELSESGVTRRRLYHLRNLLAKGISLTTSMREAIPEMPFSVVSALGAAEPLGQIQVTLRRLIEQTSRPEQTPDMARLPFYRFYGVGLTIMLLNLLGFYMFFILPKFREIFRDFNTDLPPATKFLLNWANMEEWGGPLVVVFLIASAAGLFIAIGWLLERSFILRRPSGFQRWLVDFMGNYTPVLHRLFRDRALGDVCHLLSDASRAGVPLPDALDRAVMLDINSHVKRKLNLWRVGLMAGQSPATAAISAGLPPLVSGLLNPAQSPRSSGTKSAADVFDFLARYYRARFSRLLITIQAAMEPVLVLLLGLIVGFFCYALFTPLVVLINAVSGTHGPGAL